MEIEYTEIAIKDLLRFDKPDRILIAKKIEYLAANYEELKRSKKITELKGKHKGLYRFVVARKIRVLFQVKNHNVTILVVRVGKRKDIYE